MRKIAQLLGLAAVLLVAASNTSSAQFVVEKSNGLQLPTEYLDPVVNTLAAETSADAVELNTLFRPTGENGEWFEASGADPYAMAVSVSVAVVSVTPEPSTVVLVASGLLGVFGVARRRRTQ